MTPTGKLLAGLAGVGIVTWLTLQPLGYARDVADDLESRTATALESEGAEGIDVTVGRRPVDRTVTLSGDVPNDLRRRMREIALAQPGVSDALWEGEDIATVEEGGGEGASATPAEVASCQEQLTALLAEDRIQFRSGSAYLNPASNRLLDRLAEAAGDCEGVRIEIAGHTDSRGSENLNREMSGTRAVRVRDALIERGLPADMLRTVGRGSSEPLGDDPRDPANRRIEFTVSAATAGSNGGDS